jgi:hypothetical protein
MTNLDHLKVSLTKHGAHKIATLLKTYNSKQILNHLTGSVDGVNIERVQALKNLSADSHDLVPILWDEVRVLGNDAINALVLIAIVMSHRLLIEALQTGASKNKYQGKVVKSVIIDNKAFTNFKHTLVELGYGFRETDQSVDYNFSKLFKIPKLNSIAAKIFALKLKAAKWDGKNSLEDELVRLGINKAFSIDEHSFRAWMSKGILAPIVSLMPDDRGFFEGDDEKLAVKTFVFVKGHVPKKEGKVNVSAPITGVEAELLHNAIQTKLYIELSEEYGADCVGTENNSGSGTAIDVVVQTSEYRWFYEIKTSDSVKACIRQAIPQLLEYAYWQCDAKRADKLFIVGPSPITKSAEKYLNFLRKNFNLPFYYKMCSV